MRFNNARLSALLHGVVAGHAFFRANEAHSRRLPFFINVLHRVKKIGGGK